LAAGLVLWCGTAASAAEGPPRLGVVVVVDQLSARTLEAHLPLARAGLRRLTTEGFRVREAVYPYAPPVTAAGHATLSTGALPSVHGVPANAWFDAEKGRVVLPGEDPRFQILGRLPREIDPVAPTHLRTTTLGDALKAQSPGAKVVSVAGKDRSALMLGGEGADLALWIDRTEPRMTSSTRYARELPSWLAPVSQALAAALPKASAAGGTAGGTAGVGVGAGGPDGMELLRRSAAADEAVADAALAAVRELGLGRDATPDLLLVSFSRFDEVAHAHGALSAQARTTFRDVDTALGKLLAGLDRAVGRGHYTVALSADHGGSPVPEELASRGVRAGRVDSKALMARLEQAADDALGAGDWFAAYSGNTGYYVREGARERIHGADAALRRVAQAEPGVQDLLPGPALAAGALPGPVAALYRSAFVPGRSPDFVLVLAPYWLVDREDMVSHNSPYLYDRQVPLLFAGAGVRPGALDSASVLDLAPTLGRLLGVGPPASAQGRVLTEALEEGPRAPEPRP
jgi:predicted AlkP superfamily pyrophosphatase or phosphodiesterase